jgi:hypothetical protein
MVTNDTTALYLKVKKSVKDKFKAICQKKHHTMSGTILNFIDDTILEDEGKKK